MALRVYNSWSALRKALEARIAQGIKGWSGTQPDSIAAPVWEALDEAPIDWEGEVLEIGCRPALRAKTFVEGKGCSYAGADFAGDPEEYLVLRSPRDLKGLEGQAIVIITTTLQSLSPNLQKSLLSAAFKVAPIVVLIEQPGYLKISRRGIKTLFEKEVLLAGEPHLVLVLKKR